MRRICKVFAIFITFYISNALAFDVISACRQPAANGKDTDLLLNLVCKSDVDCWPDPDNVELEFIDEGIGNAINNMVWIDKKGNLFKDAPNNHPIQAVWDMAQTGKVIA